ncbi:MAG: membrane protein insertase YidC [Candidatus Cloacimonetes bacterium]|nr:membrane protein insertase YidC [Candidatus Cloacimonadota bacterium]
MEKRTIIAIVLIFLIYWISSQYFWKPAADLTSKQQNQPITNTISHPNEITHPITDKTDIDNNNIITNNEIKNNIILENDKLIISFTNSGALINQITLKEFFLADKISPVQLIPQNQKILQLNIQNELIPYNDVAYQWEYVNGKTNQISFFLKDTNNNKVFQKVYTLTDNYNLEMDILGKNMASFDTYSISLNSGINITEESKSAVKDAKNTYKFITLINMEKPEELTLNKLNKGNQTYRGNVMWAAVRSKYFVMSLIPEEKISTYAINAGLSNPNTNNNFSINQTPGFSLDIRYNIGMNQLSDKYTLYLGPVDYDNLLAYNNGMENITELGHNWLKFLVKIFITYISFLYSLIPNYGLVIILFALTLKILLTPLTAKSLHASKKMQKIQPMLKDIQQKYKNDVKKQQEELSKLYKEHGVSPLGGCLPMLLQMPIFFALYPILKNSIGFRQAHFIGWITDLSEPDPYWILPILMGVFMFIQQKMMMTTQQDTSNMDEKQQAMAQSQKMMMYMMPPFMVFIFSGLPSGLVLYWTVFNVFTIIHQYFINKKHNEKELA